MLLGAKPTADLPWLQLLDTYLGMVQVIFNEYACKQDRVYVCGHFDDVLRNLDLVKVRCLLAVTRHCVTVAAECISELSLRRRCSHTKLSPSR